jgi:hypothetical protein
MEKQKLLSKQECYDALEQTRKNIINKYCCRLHIIDPEDAKLVSEIEESQRLIRIEIIKESNSPV